MYCKYSKIVNLRNEAQSISIAEDSITSEISFILGKIGLLTTILLKEI